jgi:hypothetical protein
MQSVPQPKSLKVYQLVKQVGLTFAPWAYNTVNNTPLGLGFFTTLQEAEHHRTMGVLGDSGPTYHIFELEVPNPAYKE